MMAKYIYLEMSSFMASSISTRNLFGALGVQTEAGKHLDEQHCLVHKTAIRFHDH